jgi:hypothetical protein
MSVVACKCLLFQIVCLNLAYVPSCIGNVVTATDRLVFSETCTGWLISCGVSAVQWEQNQGRCGICGDPWHLVEPRPHEAGGQFAKGIISRHYTSGQVSK